jgi:hypothetical protein
MAVQESLVTDHLPFFDMVFNRADLLECICTTLWWQYEGRRSVPARWDQLHWKRTAESFWELEADWLPSADSVMQCSGRWERGQFPPAWQIHTRKSLLAVKSEQIIPKQWLSLGTLSVGLELTIASQWKEGHFLSNNKSKSPSHRTYVASWFHERWQYHHPCDKSLEKSAPW